MTSSSNRKSDEFSIDLTLRHESCDPAAISSVLSMEPSLSLKGEERAHRTSLWQGTVARGSKDVEYSEALKAVVALLNRCQEFFQEFTASGGDVAVTLNDYADICTATDFKDGPTDPTRFKMVELELYPEFMEKMAANGITLRVCVWV